MPFVKKVVAGAAAPIKQIKANPWAILGIVLVILVAFRFRGQILGALSKIPFVGSGATKLAGEG